MRITAFGRLVCLVALLWGTALPAFAKGDLAAAIDWLKTKQATNGGFSDGFSEQSSVGATTDAILAAAAQGADISSWGAVSPLDYLATQVATSAETGALAKTILVAVATGQNPARFGESDLLAKLNANYNASSGTFKGLLNDHAFAMLALKAAGQPIPEKAATALEGLQTTGGGWSLDGTSQADTNSTSVALQALVAAGRTAQSESITKALAFLKTQQNTDGGFPYQKPSEYGTATDANSTAYVIQALIASNQALPDWNNPDEALAKLQLPGGAFEYQPGQGANYLATAQAIPALAGTTMVKLPVVNASRPATARAAAQTTPTAGAASPTATTSAATQTTPAAGTTPAANATPSTLPTTGSAPALPAAMILVAGLALLLVAGGLVLGTRPS